MSNIPQLKPTAENTFIITYPDHPQDDSEYDFAAILTASHDYERNGDIEKACNLRLEAFHNLMNIFPDDQEITLDWEDDQTQIAIELIRCSAIDHFLVGDFEMAAGMLEFILDIDPEDHTEATKPLAYCYIELEEFELFDEIINDISDKYAEKETLKILSEYRMNGNVPMGEITHFKKSFPIFFEEFVADNHDITPAYIADIDSAKPSKQAQARELWLQTEHIWNKYPELIDLLRKAI